jgi:hypothetical protein
VIKQKFLILISAAAQKSLRSCHSSSRFQQEKSMPEAGLSAGDIAHTRSICPFSGSPDSCSCRTQGFSLFCIAFFQGYLKQPFQKKKSIRSI